MFIGNTMSQEILLTNQEISWKVDMREAVRHPLIIFTLHFDIQRKYYFFLTEHNEDVLPIQINYYHHPRQSRPMSDSGVDGPSTSSAVPQVNPTSAEPPPNLGKITIGTPSELVEIT